MKIWSLVITSILQWFSINIHSEELNIEEHPVTKCCQSNDSLDMTIIVRSTTSKTLTHYRIYALVITNGTKGEETGPETILEDLIDKDRNTTYKRSHISRSTLNLQLKKNGIVIHTKTFFSFDEKAEPQCYADHDIFNNRTCEIILDLTKICQEFEKPSLLEGQQRELKKFWCKTDHPYFHSWCLRYHGGPCIGELPGPPAISKTSLELQHLEKFDDKIEVQCFVYEKTLLLNQLLSVTRKDEILPTLNYTSWDHIYFECKEDPFFKKYTHYLGVVDQFNVIRVQDRNKTFINNTFSLSDNGTMLCCLYYSIEKNIITRHVRNKTVLVYSGDFESQGTPYTSSLNYNKLYIGAGSTLCIVFLLIIIAKICLFKKCSSQRQLELETYGPAEVQYADLDNLRENSNRTVISNGLPYATIIGSLHQKK